jgi:hypothetical protein
MERVNAPIERRFFESREQEEHYVALARGFNDVTEMRSHYAANPRKRARNDSAGVDDCARRLTVLKLSEGIDD